MNGENRIKQLLAALSSEIFFLLPPFLLGGVYSHRGINLIIMFVCALSAFSYSLYLLAAKKSFAVSSVALPFAAIIVFSLLQLVPLPIFLLKILSPRGYFFHALEGSGARPLSMSVPDTVYSIFRVLTLIFLSSILAKNIFLDSKKRKQAAIDTVIFISTTVIGLSIILRLLHIDTWLYGKINHGGFLLYSVLINPNHAAGYFGISGILALTSIYTTTFPRKKIFYASLFFLHSVAVAATLSRAGIAAYVLALILFFITNKNFIKKHEGYRFHLAVSAVVLALILIYRIGLKLLEHEFNIGRSDYFSKLGSIARAKEYFVDFFFTGSGLGSFSKVFSYYNPNPEVLATQLENEPIQFILETGVFFALAVFAGFVALIVFGQRETKRKKGLLTVLFFVIIHNTLDFNLHNFATLFPVVLVLVLLVKPVQLHGKTKTAALVSMALLALATMLFTGLPGGQKLLGYPSDEPFSYEKAVFLYPADYTIPLKTAIKKLNSQDQEIFASAEKEISLTISKSPKYYFGYYLNGVYLLRLGAVEPALGFFKEAAAHCTQKKYTKLLNKIYSQLVAFGIRERITDIISLDEKHKKDLERFIFKISANNASAIDFANKNRDIFFISVIRNLITEQRFNEALDLINKITDENENLTDFERGQLLIYRGKIAEHDKLFKEAFKLYMQGADLTRRFEDYLAAAYCALQLDHETQDSVDYMLKNMTLKTSGNLGKYYKWLSSREFNVQNYTSGFKYLERAIELTKNPYWQLEMANMYVKQEMHYSAAQNFLKITREYPKFKPQEMKKRYEEEKLKAEKDKEKNMKEFLFRSPGQ